MSVGRIVHNITICNPVTVYVIGPLWAQEQDATVCLQRSIGALGSSSDYRIMEKTLKTTMFPYTGKKSYLGIIKGHKGIMEKNLWKLLYYSGPLRVP